MTTAPFTLTGDHLDGRNLVEASAGTGKTFALAALYLRLLLERQLTVDQLLVVTFTEAATSELRGRVRDRLRSALEGFRSGESGDGVVAHLLARSAHAPRAREKDAARLVEALRCFDDAQIFTIHGFCQRVLQQNAFECGVSFDAELVKDERPLVREVVDDFWRRELFAGPPALLAHARRRNVTPETLVALAWHNAKAPLLRVVPEPSEGDDEAPVAACQAAFDALGSLWATAREPVRDLLSTHPDLHRNRYRTTSIPGWIAALDLYLASGDPLAPCDPLEKFAPQALALGVKTGKPPLSHPVFPLCGALVACRAGANANLDSRLVSLQVRLVEHVRDEMPRRKREKNVRSFDDLLRDVRDALTGDGGPALAVALGQRYRAALIDEFQDTDPVQYEIFRTLFPDEHRPLFLIGDPKQAIYGFRGADVFAYLEAARTTERRWTLGENWRSTPNLVRAVNEVFSPPPDNPFVLPQIPFQPVAAASVAGRAELRLDEGDAAPLQLWFVARSGDKPLNKGAAATLLPKAVGGEILRLLRAGAQGLARLGDRPLEPGDLAVLVRTNRQAAEIKRELDALQVPAVLYGTGSLFASAEAEELRRVLAAAVEPRDEARLRAALVTALFGVSGDDLARLAGDEAGWDSRLRQFARYRELWAERGFVVMARTLLADEGVRARLLPRSDGERRLTNVLHLVEVLQRAAVDEKLGPEGLVQWLNRRMEEGSDADEYQLRLETDEKALKVITVHRSKGLEYPVVFCPYEWRGSKRKDGAALCHDPDRPLTVVLDLGSEKLADHRRLAEEETLAENLRLLYVALTRARNRCYLAWGGIKDAETSAPAHLFHPGLDLATLSDDQVYAQLEQLRDRAGGTVGVAPLPAPDPGAGGYTAPRAGPSRVQCRSFEGRIPAQWGVSSFSSLVSGREEGAEFPDRDEQSARETPREDGEETPTFFSFPRGPRAGNCLHEVLEGLDYRAGLDETKAAVGRALGRWGFDPSWVDPVAEGLDRVVNAQLEPGLTLASLAPADRVNEMEFYLPTGLLTPRGLAGVFAAHGGPSVPDTLAGALGTLEFRPVRGHLKGFVDLVFCAGGRYFVADWKSNHLGDRGADYGPAALRRAVDEHLYALQYHLYVAALHRHLAARVPGYDYDLHFGGVFYLFLRGVDPQVPGQGVHRDRPPRALVEALADHLAGKGQP